MSSTSGLWFDVEKERDTTRGLITDDRGQLWFDVEKERDTTYNSDGDLWEGCGLM